MIPSNLPPGCMPHHIPGDRPEDIEADARDAWLELYAMEAANDPAKIAAGPLAEVSEPLRSGLAAYLSRIDCEHPVYNALLDEFRAIAERDSLYEIQCAAWAEQRAEDEAERRQAWGDGHE